MQVHQARGRHGQCGGVAHAHRARAEREAAELDQHQVKAERPPDSRHGATIAPRGFQHSRDAGARGPEAGRSCRTEPASEPVEPAEPVHSRLVAPLSQAPVAYDASTGKTAYVGVDQLGLVAAIQASVETARSSVVARLDQLANEMKDKNTGSPNTVPTAEHAQMETKLNLAKSVIKMLMQPYHTAGSASVGTGSPRPVKDVLEPYVSGACPFYIHCNGYTGGTALAATLRSVVVAKVTTRPAEVAGRLSSSRGAHLGRSGRVGGCAGKGTHARRAKVMCGRGIGQGEGF